MANKDSSDLIKNIQNLMDGSEFVPGDSVDILTLRPKIRTPIRVLNAILGGGIPFGSIVECYGESQSGKSTASYETAGIFQKEYPEGVVVLLDSESSGDNNRLVSLGVDIDRLWRISAVTLESGFSELYKLFKRSLELSKKGTNIPIFIIWDTIAACSTNAQFDKGGANAGGIAESARIIKTGLRNLIPYLHSLNIVIMIINQVSTQFSQYTSSLGSSGGHGLKHDVHLKLKFKKGKTSYDGIYPEYQSSSLSIEKSKISPIFGDIPLTLYIPSGGSIHSAWSLLEWCTYQLPVINKAAWSRINEDYYNKYQEIFSKFEIFDKSFRYDSLISGCTDDILDLFEIIVADDISSRYALQSKVIKNYRDDLYNKLIERLGITKDLDEISDILNSNGDSDVQ